MLLSTTNTRSQKTIQTITAEEVIDCIEKREITYGSARKLYLGTYKACSYFKKHCGMELLIDLEKINEQIKMCNKMDLLTKQKLPNIPEEYFNKILNKSQEVMRNLEETPNTRMIAAGIVLLSQTGLRVSEILTLTTDRLLSMKLSKNGKVVNFIHYSAIKPTKAGEPLLEFDIFCTPLAAEAFAIMKDVREKISVANKKNTLFVLSTKKKLSLPFAAGVFYTAYRNFVFKHLPNECLTRWEGIKPTDYQPKQNQNVTVYIPDTRQYRVHVCSVLYSKGVSLTYIKNYMGHLSESMMGYYVRPKNVFQEDAGFTGKTMKELIDEDLTLLGGNSRGREIKDNIQKFIQQNNFNIHTDIDEIINTLGDKVVIRGKTGGICLKTSFVPCSEDGITDKIMCAHSICPNLFHFYYMIDVTYLDFQTLKQTYFVLKQSGAARAAEKELRKTKDLIQRRLIPELNELEKELSRKGRDEILSQHPSLTDVIDMQDEIRKEAEEWKMKE